MIAQKIIAKVILPYSRPRSWTTDPAVGPGYLKEIAIVPNTFRVQHA